MKNRHSDATPNTHRAVTVWIKRLTCTLSLVASFACSAQVEVTQLFYHEVLRQYEQGAVAYEKGDYESAYADLSLAAQRGVKDAQYLLGFMYLQGEYAPRSIPIGMAWLGTALEVENK
jgi:TPR repeat protein